MVGWKLEVGKMFLYVSFPVFCFHYFNQPKNFEAAVEKVKREMYVNKDPEGRKALQDYIIECREKEQRMTLEAMESGKGTFNT